MSRMSLKSLGRCICTSKKLAPIIRTKEFRDLYLLRSMTKPRVLLMNYAFRGDVLFYSVYQEEKPLLSSGQQTMRISSDANYEISKPIRGLISIRGKTKVVICNPGTKKFMTLSEIQAPKGAVMHVRRSYFGYDEDKDVFKVLCVTEMESESGNEFQILTVRSSEESWRQITCEHPHTPLTYQALCKGGVLYYGAKSTSGEYLIVSFNVSSEKFTVTKFQDYIDFHWEFVNYNREVALVKDSAMHRFSGSNGTGVFEMWVRNEFTGDWKSKRIVVHGWNEAVGNMEFSFKGTIGTGELVFATNKRSFVVFYYDIVTQQIRKSKIEGEFTGLVIKTFLDHLDSPQLM